MITKGLQQASHLRNQAGCRTVMNTKYNLDINYNYHSIDIDLWKVFVTEYQARLKFRRVCWSSEMTRAVGKNKCESVIYPLLTVPWSLIYKINCHFVLIPKEIMQNSFVFGWLIPRRYKITICKTRGVMHYLREF